MSASFKEASEQVTEKHRGASRIVGLVLTKNEEANLQGCLQSLSWCDDVIVLDSLSSDGTVQIAKAAGARVVERKFDDYAMQRNYGLKRAGELGDWILMLDADERCTEALAREIRSVTDRCEDDISMFLIRRRDYFLGTWIKRSGGYPTWFGRLSRRGCVSVERPINEEYRAVGTVGRLEGHIDHFPFRKGIGEWILKHDRYASMEASLKCDERLERISWSSIIGSDPVARRRSLKRLLYRVPARPFLMFIGLYFVRGGFIEGRAGLSFCFLRAWYEFLIDLKQRELLRKRSGLSV